LLYLLEESVEGFDAVGDFSTGDINVGSGGLGVAEIFGLRVHDSIPGRTKGVGASSDSSDIISSAIKMLRVVRSGVNRNIVVLGDIVKRPNDDLPELVVIHLSITLKVKRQKMVPVTSRTTIWAKRISRPKACDYCINRRIWQFRKIPAC